MPGKRFDPYPLRHRRGSDPVPHAPVVRPTVAQAPAMNVLRARSGNSGMQRIIARQPVMGGGKATIPTDLMSSPALHLMSKEALQVRYDRIAETLARFDRSTADTALLDRQLVVISTELGRRLALEAGRTFHSRDIEKMRKYLVRNAKKSDPDSCIVCMNEAIRLLLGDPDQPITQESVDATMELLRQSGRASAQKEIGFADARGRVTRGGGRPHHLLESVAQALFAMVGGDVGWSVFGMSLVDGYHSVTLIVDNNDPARPRIYWADQVLSGWKEFKQDALDKKVTLYVQDVWDGQAEGKKHTTVVRLWRLRQ